MAFLRKWGLSILMLIVIILTFSYGFYKRSVWRRDHALMELRTYEVPNGWGYDILRDGRPFFHQNIMPGLSGNRVFHSREDAQKVGEFMCDLIRKGQLPTITEQQMRDMQIYIPADTNHVRDSVNYDNTARAAYAEKLKKDSIEKLNEKSKVKK